MPDPNIDPAKSTEFDTKQLEWSMQDLEGFAITAMRRSDLVLAATDSEQLGRAAQMVVEWWRANGKKASELAAENQQLRSQLEGLQEKHEAVELKAKTTREFVDDILEAPHLAAAQAQDNEWLKAQNDEWLTGTAGKIGELEKERADYEKSTELYGDATAAVLRVLKNVPVYRDRPAMLQEAIDLLEEVHKETDKIFGRTEAETEKTEAPKPD